MDGVSFQASVNNLSQMDRHQQDSVRTPVVNQQQNAEIALEEANQSFLKPVEADTVEKKKVNARQRKQDFDKKNERRKKTKNADASGKSANQGYFLDVNA